MTTQADLLLMEMKKFMGLTGRPNVATRWYAMGHGSEYLDAAWCDMFLSFCASKAKLAGVVGEFALCQSHLNWFKRLGLVDMKPSHGAIVFFDWDNDNWADHVGVVENVYKDGSFDTIEGNTSDTVARRRRFLRDVQGFAHPAYLPVAPVYPGKLLMFGSRGEAVKQAQRGLLKRGYPLRSGADGVYGHETVAAVKAFQRVERSKNPKIEVDGKIGPITWLLLFP